MDLTIGKEAIIKEINADRVCEKCRAPYVPVGGETGYIYYGPSCECWLDDILNEAENSRNCLRNEELLELIEHEDPIDPLFIDFDDDEFVCKFDNENSDWIADNERHQQNLEKESAIHFANLKIKYKVTSYQDRDPISPLYKILLQLENATKISEISNFDIEWLEKENLFFIVAQSYEKNFHLSREGWNLVKACKFYRYAGYPCASLEISKYYYSPNPNRKLLAAIFTIRGAAFRDLRQFQSAILCGEAALNLDPDSFYACNMIGATYFQLSDYETGYAYFQLALKKGGTPAFQNKLLENQIKISEMDHKIKAAQFLLRQDPTRYSWARKYLGSSLF